MHLMFECPLCGELVEGDTDLSITDTPDYLHSGDVVKCSDCGAWLVVKFERDPADADINSGG